MSHLGKIPFYLKSVRIDVFYVKHKRTVICKPLETFEK
jgi:hypothetical protein